MSALAPIAFRGASFGRDDIVWLVTIVALAVPLIVLPVLDRILRKR